MKFHQLPIGARFVWRDATWRKVAPLKAASEGDDPQQKLIPRSAQVSRLPDDEAVADATPGLPTHVSGSLVETATWDFVARCRTAIDQLEPALADEQRHALSAAIERAAQQLLSRLATRGDVP